MTALLRQQHRKGNAVFTWRVGLVTVGQAWRNIQDLILLELYHDDDESIFSKMGLYLPFGHGHSAMGIRPWAFGHGLGCMWPWA